MAITVLSLSADQLGRIRYLATFVNRRAAKRLLRSYGFEGVSDEIDRALALIGSTLRRRRAIARRAHRAGHCRPLD